MRRKRRRKNKKNLISIKLIIVLLIIILIIIHVVKSTSAKYKSDATSSADVDLAYYFVKPTSLSQSIKLASVLPSDDTTFTYDFSVANYDGTTRTETALTYTMQLRTTTNLYLNYKVHKKNQNTNLITNTVTQQDSDGTYFKVMTISGDSFGFSSNELHEYQLEVEFPTTPAIYSSAKYEGTIEYLELTINTQQRIQ